MKKWLCLIVIAISAFLLNEHVYAANVVGGSETATGTPDLNGKDLTVECIYSDGSLFITSSSEGNLSVTREPSQISSHDAASNDNISEFSILNNSTKTNGSCYDKVTATVLTKKTQNKETKPDGSESVVGDEYTINVAYYKFGDQKESITYGDAGQTKPWYKFFTDDEDYAATEVSNLKVYSLVSERIYVENEKVLSNGNVKKCYYVKKAEQASGTNNYLTFYLFNNITLLENNGMITSYGNTILGHCPKEEKIYLNDPSQKIDTSKTSPKFFYGAAKFNYASDSDDDHVDLYEKTSEPPSPNDSEGKNACESIPATVKVLKTIIQIMQIGIPAFVIILTSIDIFRMVVAGNLDEELPKRKKTIIIRFIIMLVFFFLPLIINVILTTMYNSSDWFRKEVGIKDIKCLFE